jgi:hypothetical protein
MPTASTKSRRLGGSLEAQSSRLLASSWRNPVPGIAGELRRLVEAPRRETVERLQPADDRGDVPSDPPGMVVAPQVRDLVCERGLQPSPFISVEHPGRNTDDAAWGDDRSRHVRVDPQLRRFDARAKGEMPRDADERR